MTEAGGAIVLETQKARYAVAGVSGHTGAALARRLVDAGERVRAIVRRSDAGATRKAQAATTLPAAARVLLQES
ncbi:MAG TPA: hypothetical protein VGA51_05950 [Casimicrobiaceae bacterium]